MTGAWFDVYERDLLVKKISDKIDKASWITNGGMLGIIIHQG